MEITVPIPTLIIFVAALTLGLIGTGFSVYWKRRKSLRQSPAGHPTNLKTYDYIDQDSQSQLELDRYLKESLTGIEIGRHYERQIGHKYESDGYDVLYNGAVKGFADLGRDLIVRGGNEVFIVQTKCWSAKKLIQPKHIFQLYGSVEYYKLLPSERDRNVHAVFYTSSEYSDGAMKAGRLLGVDLKKEPLDKSYPQIKCNITTNGDRIYHLPFDEFYDRVKIKPHAGEFYARTVKEAVEQGFRRAKRYRGAG